LKNLRLQPFDVLVFIFQAIIVFPGLGFGDWLLEPLPKFIVTAWFFLGLYLKRYDPDYVAGIAVYNHPESIIPNIILIGGTMLCGFLLALSIIPGFLWTVSALSGIEVDIIFNHWLAIVLILPSIFILPFYMTYLFRWASDYPADFLKSEKANPVLRFISRTGIFMQSLMLMHVIYMTFAPTGVEPDIALSFIGAFFLTSIFYLPIRVHEFFQNPGYHNWVSYISTVLAIIAYQHSIDWLMLFLV